MPMTMTLAEFASVNSDATYTVVRGWLRVWNCELFPSELNAAVFAEIHPNTLAAGTHDVRLTVRSAEGTSVLDQGSLTVTDARVATRFVIPISLEARRVEQVALDLHVGLLLKASSLLFVRHAGQP